MAEGVSMKLQDSCHEICYADVSKDTRDYSSKGT